MTTNTSHPLPLKCQITQPRLEISIGVQATAFAAENHPVFYDGDGNNTLRVVDAEMFLKEVVREINYEDEAGNTLLTHMLDAAILRAVENGSEGAELVENAP
jgi:hypothetical protein